METANHEGLVPGASGTRRSRTTDAILYAAMGIVMHGGVASLSMSALAEAAGLSRQTLYNHFPDIDAVLAAMAAMGNDGIADLRERLEAEEDPRDGLRVFVSVVLEAAAAGHPSQLALTMAVPPSARDAIREHERSAEALVIELLERGRASGAFHADVDPTVDGRFIYRAAFAAHDLALEPDVDVDRLSERITRDLLRMVEAGSGD